MPRKLKNEKKHVEAPTPVKQRNILLASIALLGVALTAALFFNAATSSSLPYCGSGSGCDIVRESRWSMLLGLPITAWGFVVYLVIAVAGLAATRRSLRWRITILFATLGFAVSVYLNTVALMALDAFCVYCLVSFLLISILYMLSWHAERIDGLGGWRLGSSIAAVLLVGAMHLHYSGVFDPAAGPEDPYLRDLAEHLRASNVKFFGAYWCPHCQQQKSAFGASAKRLPYVECSPNGQRGAPATECIGADIKNYPTWIIDERRLERMLSPRQLARYTGFRAPSSSSRQ